MDPVFFAIGMVLVYGAVSVRKLFMHRINQKRKASFNVMTQRYPLAFKELPELNWFSAPFFPVAEGEVNGLKVTFILEKAELGVRNPIVLKVKTQYQGKGWMVLTPNNPFKRIRNLFSALEEKTGDEIFDDYFLIHASGPKFLSRLLSPVSRDEILAFYQDFRTNGAIEFKQGTLIFSLIGSVFTPKKEAIFTRVLDLFLVLGAEINAAQGKDGFQNQREDDILL